MNAAGIRLLKDFEGFSDKAYQDIVGVWTIGYGFTDDVKPGDRMTRAEAEQRLQDELESYESAVLRACKVEPNENQLAAMTSFAFNVGRAGMAGSSVIKAHNRGNFEAAARAFGLWNKAGGKVVAGLVRRRAAEAALYLTPVEGEHPMPQEVEPEKPLTQSKVAVGGTVTAAVSGLSVAAQVAGDVAAVREGMGPWLPYAVLAFAVIGVGVGLFLVWDRVMTRRRGNA